MQLCSIESHLDKDGHVKATISKPEQHAAVAWVTEIGRYIKSLDSKHLYIDNSGFYRGAPEILDIPTVDVVGYEYYPHWAVATHLWVDRKLIDEDAELISQHGKVDVPVEIGWDRTNWFFKRSLQKLVAGIEENVSISGDGFWALQAHAPDHGWQTIPADDRSWKAMVFGESGEWWAMYYTGKRTKINGMNDMAARAQLLRSHFYAMAGVAVPAHRPSPPPTITWAEQGVLAWRGSSGSASYDIERGDTQKGPWQRICDHCVDDSLGTWTVHGQRPEWYRITAYNLDGVASSPSEPREMQADP